MLHCLHQAGQRVFRIAIKHARHRFKKQRILETGEALSLATLQHDNGLRAIDFKGREVYIIFDSDAVTKPEVRTAERDLARVLVAVGAIVHIVRIPPDGDDKVGLDDFIVKHGPEAFADLLAATPPVDADDLAGAEIVLTNHTVHVEVKGDDKKTTFPALSLTQIANDWRMISGNDSPLG